MTHHNTKKKQRTTVTTPTTIDQRSVKASSKVFGSQPTTKQPLGEKQNIQRVKRRKHKQ